jgi:hypothetical protein
MPTGRMSAVPGLCGHIALRLTLAGLLFGAPTGAADAQPHHDPGNDRSNEVQLLDQILPTIRRAHPGDLSDAHGPIYGPSGDPRYHLKWITPEGSVYWFDADARSGQVERVSPGRDTFDDR